MNIKFEKSIEPLIRKNKITEVGKNMRFTIQDAKIGKDIFTRNGNSCTIAAITTGQETLIGHFDPKYFNINTFYDKFMYQVKELQDKYGVAKAIITGGWETNRIDPHCTRYSSEVGSTVAAAFDDMPMVLIFGKKSHVKTYDNLFATKNEITIANEEFENLGIAKKNIKNLPPEFIQKKLEEMYEWVELDENMLN